MLSRKLYLLLALLSLFVVCSICAEEKPRKTDAVSDAKKNVVDHANDVSNRRKDKYVKDDDEEDNIDDRLMALPSYADNRYSSLGFPEGNYRTRARWQAQSPPSSPSPFFSPFDDLMNGNDRSRFELPNGFPSSLPSTSSNNNPVLSSASSCYSLVDAQYPIFSDICGAVPQARYSLPNTVGHRERWQVAQALSALASSASDPSCTRSLRLLICPALFPPCPTRHEPPAVLPCQSYCRAVKARCATPALDLLPCEVLPYSSDLCPTNQAYGSFAPPGAFPSMNQPSPMSDGFRSYPSLRSLLSAQGFQAPMMSSPLSPGGSQQSAGASNPYNSGAQALDSLTPLLVDFPPRSFNNDQRPTSRYSPLTRSSSEIRPQADTQFSTGSRPLATSSIVKA